MIVQRHFMPVVYNLLFMVLCNSSYWAFLWKIVVYNLLFPVIIQPIKKEKIMRIFSTFHDYYDSASSHGVDTSIIFNRKEEVIHLTRTELNKNDYLRGIASIKIPHKAYIEARSTNQLHGVIGFCGKCYPFIQVYDKYCYTSNDINNSIPEKDSLNVYHTKQVRDFFNSTKNIAYEYSDTFRKHYWDNCVNYFNHLTFDDTFRHLKTPTFAMILSWNNVKIIINPRLKDYDFQKVKDSYTAFQDISMYLSNQMVDTTEIQQNIPDTILAEKKGFDKWSFRKMPEEQKHRKNKV